MDITPQKVRTAVGLGRFIFGRKVVSSIARKKISKWAETVPTIAHVPFPDPSSVHAGAGWNIRGWTWPDRRYFWLDYDCESCAISTRWSNVTGNMKKIETHFKVKDAAHQG